MREITDIKEIQKIALDILLYIDKICKENNIDYMLDSGTTLGAIRHKGFIPWDDDIDIAMTRPNYDKFLEIMDETPSRKYKALHYGENFPNYHYVFSKVVDLDTHLIESEYLQNPDLGVFVDIFPIDSADNIKIKKIKKLHFYTMLIHLSAMKRFLPNKKGKMKTILRFFAYLFAKPFGWKYWYKKYNKLLSKLSKTTFSECEKAIIYTYSHPEKSLLDRKFYETLSTTEFEGHTFPILKDYHTYLTKVYGDYMTPPPEHKRVTHHEFKIYKKD